MKKEDWTSELRDCLAGYEEPAPEGLWEKIEGNLPDMGDKRNKRPMVLWRYIAAAAILLLIVIGVDMLWFSEEGPVTIVKNVVKEGNDAVIQQSEDLIAYNNDNGIDVSSHSIVPSYNKVYDKVVSEEVTEESSEEQVDNTSDVVNNESVREKNKQDNDIAKKESGYDYMEQVRTINKKKGGGSSKLTACLYANNPIGASSMSSNGVLASSNLVNVYSDGKMFRKNSLYLQDYKEEVEHHSPVSFGLSLSYNLTDRFWLESGAVYTRVSSTFTHKVTSRSLYDEQVLYYIGIPLRAGYTFWRNKSLGIYAIAGGEADINVKAEFETEGLTRDIDKDRIQWSMNAAVGLQYNILPQVGVYVEPGLRYYIDNGSSIDNIFKDKKINLSMQIGIRCLLNK